MLNSALGLNEHRKDALHFSYDKRPMGTFQMNLQIGQNFWKIHGNALMHNYLSGTYPFQTFPWIFQEKGPLGKFPTNSGCPIVSSNGNSMADL